MTTIILDFCANCGELLPDGLGVKIEATCPMCDEPVKERRQRLQAYCESAEEAAKLRELVGFY